MPQCAIIMNKGYNYSNYTKLLNLLSIDNAAFNCRNACNVKLQFRIRLTQGI